MQKKHCGNTKPIRTWLRLTPGNCWFHNIKPTIFIKITYQKRASRLACRKSPRAESVIGCGFFDPQKDFFKMVATLSEFGGWRSPLAPDIVFHNTKCNPSFFRYVKRASTEKEKINFLLVFAGRNATGPPK